jgi:hypothetical protein
MRHFDLDVEVGILKQSVAVRVQMLLQSSALFKILRGEADQAKGQCLVHTKLHD